MNDLLGLVRFSGVLIQARLSRESPKRFRSSASNLQLLKGNLAEDSGCFPSLFPVILTQMWLNVSLLTSNCLHLLQSALLPPWGRSRSPFPKEAKLNGRAWVSRWTLTTPFYARRTEVRFSIQQRSFSRSDPTFLISSSLFLPLRARLSGMFAGV